MEDLYKTVEEIPDPIEAQVTGNSKYILYIYNYKYSSGHKYRDT